MIVQPGDKLIVPIAPGYGGDRRERDEIKGLLEAAMPGVEVVVGRGIQGGPFVYRAPRPPTAEEVQVAEMLAKMFQPSRKDKAE